MVKIKKVSKILNLNSGPDQAGLFDPEVESLLIKLNTEFLQIASTIAVPLRTSDVEVFVSRLRFQLTEAEVEESIINEAINSLTDILSPYVEENNEES